MTDSRELIVDTLRGRVLRGLHSGLIVRGDRLPTSRELAGEFGVDYRLVVAAWKALAEEGLVELRPRGGVYALGASSPHEGVPALPEAWIVDVLTSGLSRELPAPELHEWLRRSVETLRLRAVVIASTADQADGLCRELRDDFGFEAECVLADEVQATADAPLPVRRADVVVTTEALAAWVRRLGTDLRKPVIVIDVRPEMRGGEWAMLLRRPVYVVVATPEFGEMLRHFYAHVPGIGNLRLIVYGRDDLQQIPEGAPTYVTQNVRARLAGVRIPGRLLPAARTISTESARELFGFIVRSNIEAMSRRSPG